MFVRTIGFFFFFRLLHWNDLKINNRAAPAEIEIHKRAIMIEISLLWINQPNNQTLSLRLPLQVDTTFESLFLSRQHNWQLWNWERWCDDEVMLIEYRIFKGQMCFDVFSFPHPSWRIFACQSIEGTPKRAWKYRETHNEEYTLRNVEMLWCVDARRVCVHPICICRK